MVLAPMPPESVEALSVMKSVRSRRRPFLRTWDGSLPTAVAGKHAQTTIRIRRRNRSTCGGAPWSTGPCVWHDAGVTNSSSDQSESSKRADAALEAAEKVVYLGIAALLVVASFVLLVVAAKDLTGVIDDFGTNPVVKALDTLLLLFILVELLAAVRITMAKRELVAEPFLLVGIIASIKEIVVLSVKAAESIGEGQGFEDQLRQIAVLGVVVVLLGVTAWLLRIKEREPQEGQTNPA